MDAGSILDVVKSTLSITRVGMNVVTQVYDFCGKLASIDTTLGRINDEVGDLQDLLVAVCTAADKLNYQSYHSSTDAHWLILTVVNASMEKTKTIS